MPRTNRTSKSIAAVGAMTAFLICTAGQAWAFTDGPITAAIALEQKAYDEFMHLQVVQQLKTLRDNYVASERYYAMMREMTSGKGVAAHIAGEIISAQNATTAQIKAQFESDWIKDPAYNSQVDKAVKDVTNAGVQAVGTKVNALLTQMDNYAMAKVHLAGEIMDSALGAEKTGKQLAKLSQTGTETKPVSNADLLKALGVQIQLQAQTNMVLAQVLDVDSHVAQVEMSRQATSLRQAAIANNVPLTTKQ